MSPPPHLRPLAIFWGPKVLSDFGLNEIKGSEVDVLVFHWKMERERKFLEIPDKVSRLVF